MGQSENIEYVELSYGGTDDAAASFWFERNEHVMLPDPRDDPARRHTFHEIILVLNGHGRHTIDCQAANLVPQGEDRKDAI